MKLRIAPATKVYKDYGSHLETIKGIVWCDEEGYPMKGGFEVGKTVSDVRAKFAALGAFDHGFELVELEPKSWTVDLNPHGLI